MKKKTWLTYMAKRVCFGTLFFNVIRCIQLYDQKNLTFVDCCGKIFNTLVLKNVIKLAKGLLNKIFQDSFNKILSQHSQQLTHNRSYISQQLTHNRSYISPIKKKNIYIYKRLLQSTQKFNTSSFNNLFTNLSRV